MDPTNIESFPSIGCCYVVYADGEPVYIGQTNNTRRRINSHGFNSMRYSNHINTPWGAFKSVFVKCRFASKYGEWAMTELRLIRKIKPKFNMVHKERAA